MKTRQVRPDQWFKDHAKCLIEISETGVPGLKDYKCRKHGRGMITTAKPSDPPIPGNILGLTPTA